MGSDALFSQRLVNVVLPSYIYFFLCSLFLTLLKKANGMTTRRIRRKTFIKTKHPLTKHKRGILPHSFIDILTNVQQVKHKKSKPTSSKHKCKRKFNRFQQYIGSLTNKTIHVVLTKKYYQLERMMNVQKAINVLYINKLNSR